MILSLYYLLSSGKDAKMHIKSHGYFWALIMRIVVMVLGFLFGMFTWEVFQEQLDALEDNQTFVESDTKQYGRPQDFLKTFEDYMGKDKWWWFLPTHPTIKINYLEKLYSKAQYKQFLKLDKEVEEDEWDLNKKHFINELRRSNREKRIFMAICVMSLIGIYMMVFHKSPLVASV
jgi:hypothetical protein